MVTKAKVFLGLSITCFVIGTLIVLDVIRGPAPLNVVLPLSFILFGMFLVIRMLERDAHYAADDQQKVLAEAGEALPRSKLPQKQGGIMAK